MEKIDRQHLENCFGTDAEIEDLEAGIELLQEWIAEIKDGQDDITENDKDYIQDHDAEEDDDEEVVEIN